MAQGSSYRGGEAPTKGRNAGALGRMAGEAEKLAEQGREVGQQVQDAAGNVKRTVDRSLKEQPYTTLAVAAVIGFIVGALWKS